VPPLGVPSNELKPYKRAPMRTHEGGYYIRFNAKDVPGTLGVITTSMGKHDISIESIIQRPDLQAENANIKGENTRTIILITHETMEKNCAEGLR